LIEIGRMVGFKVLGKFMKNPEVRKVRRHEMLHAWIYERMKVTPVIYTCIVYFKYKKHLDNPFIFCGGCLFTGKISMKKMVILLTVQMIFDFFHTLLSFGLGSLYFFLKEIPATINNYIADKKKVLDVESAKKAAIYYSVETVMESREESKSYKVVRCTRKIVTQDYKYGKKVE